MSRRSKAAMWFFRHAPWAAHPTVAKWFYKIGARLTMSHNQPAIEMTGLHTALIAIEGNSRRMFNVFGAEESFMSYR